MNLKNIFVFAVSLTFVLLSADTSFGQEKKIR